MEIEIKKNRYLIVMILAALLLFCTGIGVWYSSGFVTGWGLVFALCCFACAAGLVLEGFFYRNLLKGLRAIRKSLEVSKSPNVRMRNNPIVKELGVAILKYFEENTKHLTECEEKLKDLQIQNHLLHRQKRNTDAIIYSICDAVIVIDEFDKLIMANEAAGGLFGFDFKAVQQQPISELIDSSKAEFVSFLSRSRKGKVQASRREIEFKTEKASQFFDCIVSCVFNNEQKVCGAVAVLHDITREKEISKAKNDFVSHVSHELKTPLASITAYSEMLYDGEATDEETRQEFYSVIQSQAQRLNRLIEDILNISRIESGLVKVQKECLSVALLIKEQLQMIKSYAEEKKIEVDGSSPIVFDQVYVDRDMISQVIVNLLSNAVKYTPEGGKVKVESEVDDTSHLVRVSVTDTGVGIPEEDVKHVFDKFYRVEANKGQAKGTGLGLNLVKQIVEKVHGGHVFVKSKVGEGSTFIFELPLATSEMAEAVK